MAALHKHPPLFLLPKHLLLIDNKLTSYMGALHRYNSMRKNLGKGRHQFITIKEYCYYADVPEEEVLKRIQ